MNAELYFAYGSNMSSFRLRARVGKVPIVGTALLPGYQLSFYKRGGDGSGKCNVHPTGKPSDVVFGILYRLDQQQLQKLDIFEGVGHGYHRKTMQCQLQSTDEVVSTVLYIATSRFTDENLLPFAWYRDFVLAGAKEQGLPASYIQKILEVETVADPNSERAQENYRLLADHEESSCTQEAASDRCRR